MAKKTWKIGEYAKGGVITVETGKTFVRIIGKEWDFDSGSNKGSSQVNAKEFTRKKFYVGVSTMSDCLTFLNDLTTSYYADKIWEWIESKVDIPVQRW